jgi:exodeoxyribonuclease V alpha subunit
MIKTIKYSENKFYPKTIKKRAKNSDILRFSTIKNSKDNNEQSIRLLVSKFAFIDEKTNYAKFYNENGYLFAGIFLDNPNLFLNKHIQVYGRVRELDNIFAFTSMSLEDNPAIFFFQKFVENIGDKTAEKIIQFYGEDNIFKIIEESPQNLVNDKFLKEEKLAPFLESYSKNKKFLEISRIFGGYGVSPSVLKKIINEWDDDKISEAIQNPYLLTEINGVGFKKCDIIGLNQNIDIDSKYRVKAGIEYSLFDFRNNSGSTLIEEEELFQLSAFSLQPQNSSFSFFLDEEFFKTCLEELIKEGKIIRFNEFLGLKIDIDTELLILEELNRRNSLSSNQIIDNIDEWIVEKEKIMKFGEKQKEAIKLANLNPNIFTLSGFAGTGKSTVAKIILELFSKGINDSDVTTTALSGIANKRIMDLTGYDGSTIASIIAKSEKSQQILDAKILVIDEASMINVLIFSKLLKSISSSCKVLIIGDPGQLPPIGAGNVFADIVNNKLVKGVTLDKIFRQSEESVITSFAQDIRNGNSPKDLFNEFEDFKFIPIGIKNYFKRKEVSKRGSEKIMFEQEKEEVKSKIIKSIYYILNEYKTELYQLYNNREFEEYLRKVQIISPMLGGKLGTRNLNKEAQKIIKPLGDNRLSLSRGDITIHDGDKVINENTEFNYAYVNSEFKRKGTSEKVKVMNGQIGIVQNIDLNRKVVEVFYPSEKQIIEYKENEIGFRVSPGFALTTHRTQGAEMDYVILPSSMTHFMMLNRLLWYTGITRAKKKVYITGEVYAFSIGVKKEDGIFRRTVLSFSNN